MIARGRRPSLFDPRSWPLAIKITLGLALILIVSGLVTAHLFRLVVEDAQVEVALGDLQDFSRVQAFRAVDAVGQATDGLEHLGSDEGLRTRLEADMRTRESLGQAGTPPTLRLDPELTQRIWAFREVQGSFEAVALLDAYGHVVAIDPVPSAASLPQPGGWTWFTAAMNRGQGAVYISNPQDDDLTGIEGIQIAVPVYSGEQADVVIGVVYAVLDLGNVVDMTQLGGRREGLILAPDGRVLLSSSEAFGASLPNSLAAELRESPQGSFDDVDVFNRAWLYGYTQLSDELRLDDQAITNLGWTVIIGQLELVAQTNIEPLSNRLGFIIGGSALAVTVAMFGFARLVLMPLRRLVRAARRVRRGDLSTPVPDLPADEVGQLSGVLAGLVSVLLQRLQRLQSAVRVSRVSTLVLDTSEMLGNVATALAEQFDYREVRIYLSDPTGRRLRIQSAFGAEGERLLRMGQQMPVDETTIIGRAILLGEPQLGGGAEKLYEAGLVPERAELALPLQMVDRSLGAVYIFSGRDTPFEPEDVAVLRLIADQLGASLENARLVEQSAASLAEIEALNRQLTRQAWEEYLGQAQDLRHTLDPENRWPSGLQTAQGHTEVKAETYTDEDGRSVLAAPLILRGEAVGTLAITRPQGEPWAADEVALLEAVAARMAIIAESIRLVDESTQRAERERKISEISTNLLQRAANVDTVLRSALSELGGALGSDHVALRIGPPPVEGDRQIGSGRRDGRPPAGPVEPDLEGEVEPPKVKEEAELGDSDGDGGPNHGQ